MIRNTLLVFITLVGFGLSAETAPTLGWVSPNTGDATIWATDSANPEFTGYGDPGSLIFFTAFIVDGSSPIGLPPWSTAVTVEPNGLWTVTPLLQNLTYQVQVDLFPALSPSIPDDIHARIVVVQAKENSTISAVTPDGGIPYDFITGPNITALSGRGEPGAQLQVTRISVADPNPVPLGTVTIDPSGTWSLPLTGTWVPEVYEVTATASIGAWSSTTTKTITINDSPSGLTVSSLAPDTGMDPNDGLTAVLPSRAIISMSPGTLLTFSIPELDASAPSDSGLEHYSTNLVTGSITAELFIFINGDQGLDTFTYRFSAIAPNGSATTIDRHIQLDRTPVPLLITAIGLNDGTNPTDGTVETEHPILTGVTEPDADLSITITHSIPENPTDPQGGGNSTLWLETTFVDVGADGTWSYPVLVDLPSNDQPYEFYFSAIRHSSGKTTSLQRNVLVTPAHSLTWVEPAALTYGNGLGPAQLDAVAVKPGIITYVPPAGTILGAGDHVLTATLVPDDSNLPTLTAEVTVTVQPASLTITADNQQKVIGTSDPSFTVSYTGFVQGDDEADLLTPVTVTAPVNSDAIGSYPLVASGATAANYVITFIDGNLLVTPIANDDFSGAQVLAPWSGSLIADTTWATREGDELLHAGQEGGRSLWYRWTAPATGQIEIDTFGSEFDTLLALYTLNNTGVLRNAGANDDRSATIVQSRRLRNVTEGLTYFIAVDGKADAHGQMVLNWVLRSGSDRFVEPHDLGSAPSGSVSVDTSNATVESGEPDHAGAAAGHSVWFLWTAPSDGILVLETLGSIDAEGGEFDTVLALYNGIKINKLTKLSADDDDHDSVTSAIGAKVVAGTEYRIAVDGSRSAAVTTGTVELTWTLRSPATN